MEEFEFKISNKLLLKKLQQNCLFILLVGFFSTTLLVVLLFDIYRISEMPIAYQVILITFSVSFILFAYCFRALNQWNGQVIVSGGNFTYKCGLGIHLYQMKTELSNIEGIAIVQDYFDPKVNCYTASIYLKHHWGQGVASFFYDFGPKIEYLTKDQAEKINFLF